MSSTGDDDRPGGPAAQPTGARERPAQQGPPQRLDGFPVSRLASGGHVHRAHDRQRGPWWFSGDGSGRFDLPAPRGSCYVATSALVALRERLGPVLSARRSLPVSTLEPVVVSRLTVSTGGAALRLANLRVAGAASFGVTRELESMTPYALPQQWAAAFAAGGLDGVRYGPRFTPGAASALALFGVAGEDTARPTDPAPVAAVDVDGAPVAVAVPRRQDLKVIAPPGRGRAPRVSRPR